MKNLSVTLNIDLSNTEEVEKLQSILTLLTGEETPKKLATKKSKTTKKEPAAQEKKVEEAAETAEETSSVTIEDLRSLVSKKVGDNREAIKNKLTELGSNNVTSLETSKYEEFHEFLESL